MNRYGDDFFFEITDVENPRSYLFTTLPDDDPYDHEHVELVLNASSKLTPSCKEVVQRTLDGQSVAEIAALTNLSTGHVYCLLHRAVERLRHLLRSDSTRCYCRDCCWERVRHDYFMRTGRRLK